MKRLNYVTPETVVVEIHYSGHLLGDLSLSDEPAPPGVLDESRGGRGSFFDDDED